MASDNSFQDFYNKFKSLFNKNPRSQTNLIVSSIGKQSQGKSYFLNKIFKESFPTKDGRIIHRGTEMFYEEFFEDYTLLDLEGLQSEEGDYHRDVFNLFTIFSISGIVMFHIKHEDLENKAFIDYFAFLLFQCYSPLKKTPSDFNKSLPKLILLIKDPRWEQESLKTIEAFEELIKVFENDLNRSLQNTFKKLNSNLISLRNVFLQDQNSKAI